MLVSAEEFTSLVDQGDEESRARLRLATATEAVWEEIVVRHPEYRLAVALNKALPERILSLLANDIDPTVRSTIAQKRSLPPDLFLRLSLDSDESVRAMIAHNKKTPPDILIKLTSDPEPIVAKAARSRFANK